MYGIVALRRCLYLCLYLVFYVWILVINGIANLTYFGGTVNGVMRGLAVEYNKELLDMYENGNKIEDSINGTFSDFSPL